MEELADVIFYICSCGHRVDIGYAPREDFDDVVDYMMNLRSDCPKPNCNIPIHRENFLRPSEMERRGDG